MGLLAQETAEAEAGVEDSSALAAPLRIMAVAVAVVLGTERLQPED